MDIYIDGSYGWTGTRIRGGLGICFQNIDINHLSISVVKDETEFMIFDNQAMEAMSMYVALWLTRYCVDVTIHSDCQHVVNSLTEWYERFQGNGWLTSKNKAVAQRDILKECGTIIEDRRKKGYIVRIEKVQAHSGIAGNVTADQCAYAGMTGGTISKNIKRIVLEYTTTIGNSVARNADLNDIKEVLTVLYGIRFPDLLPEDKLSEVYTTQDTMPNKVVDQITKKYNLYGIAPSAPEISDETFAEPVIDDAPATQEPVIVEDTVPPVEKASLSDDDLAFEIPSTTDAVNDNELRATGNYLFFACIQHNEGILVRYPNSKTCKVKKKLKITSICTIAFTTCRDCIAKLALTGKFTGSPDIAAQLSNSIAQLHISPAMFEGSKIYECAEIISELKPTILSTNSIVKYIPVGDITKICNNECHVSSIDVGEKSTLPYLKFGFI